MISLLKKILKVKDSTLKTYERNIKRLARIAGHDKIPPNKGWIAGEKGKTLIGKLNKMPLNVKRHLFVAGAVAFRAYTVDKDRSAAWSIAMNESANKYSDYMLAGKPIISSGEIFNDPVKISGSGKSIKSEDFDALKNTILEFYHMNENDRKQIGRKGKEYFNKYLNIDIISNKYEELIEHLLI